VYDERKIPPAGSEDAKSGEQEVRTMKFDDGLVFYERNNPQGWIRSENIVSVKQ